MTGREPPAVATASMENGRDEEQLLLWNKKRREILDALENSIGSSDEGMIEEGREREVRRIYNEVQQINEIYEDVAELLKYEHSRSIDEIGKLIEVEATAKLQLLDATRRKNSTLCRRCCWASIIFVTLMVLLTIVLFILHFMVR